VSISSPARSGGAASPSLALDPEHLGLQREVAQTALGDVVVRAGRRAGGPATLLLHGAAGSWTTWIPLIEASDRLGRPLADVVAIDLPGWGESVADTRGVGVQQMTAAVAEVVLARGYGSWRVIGHSLGGLIALDLASRHPERTISVGLVSPSGPAVIDAIRRPWRGGRRLPWFAGMLLAMRLFAPLGRAGRVLATALHRLGVLTLLAAPLFAARGALDPSVFEALAREVRPGAFADAARAAARYDLRAWGGIHAPVRAVRGARDVFVGADDRAALARLIPDYREHTIVGAGHFAAIERPEIVLDALLPASVVRGSRVAERV
jgi:pimeloyl-ACP methyl ester carboxylesterase